MTKFVCGTWVLGGEGFGKVDLRESRLVLESAFEKGIKIFDTALFYAHGKSVALLRDLAKSVRKDIIIWSKGGLKWDGNKVLHDASPQALRTDLEKTLISLGTDYLDCYFLHWPDPRVSLDVSMDALEQFKLEGLVREVGVCNIPHQVPYPHQIHHNLLVDGSELFNDSFPNIVYSPLEQGLLTSKSVGWINNLGKRDWRRRNLVFKRNNLESTLLKLHDQASRKSMSLLAFSLDYLLRDTRVSNIIIGPRNRDQLETISRLF